MRLVLRPSTVLSEFQTLPISVHADACVPYATINCVRGFSCAVVGARSGIRFDSRDEKLLTVGIGTGALFDGAETADATLRFLRGLFRSRSLIPTAARNSLKLVLNK